MKSKRILMIPLDERPCNYRFPLLMPKAGFTLAMPPKELMGLKKRPGIRRDWQIGCSKTPRQRIMRSSPWIL